jgi:DNA-binding transcriptional MerR regulator
MVLKQDFTRRQTMELTGATSNQLQYLERASLVVPFKITENRKQPKVWYVWEQVLEIKLIRSLRENTSLQTVRVVLNLFNTHKEEKNFRDKRIIAIDDEIFLVKHDMSDLQATLSSLKIATSNHKGIGQHTLIVLPSLKEIVCEVLEVNRRAKVVSLKNNEISKAKNKAPEMAVY